MDNISVQLASNVPVKVSITLTVVPFGHAQVKTIIPPTVEEQREVKASLPVSPYEIPTGTAIVGVEMPVTAGQCTV